MPRPFNRFSFVCILIGVGVVTTSYTQMVSATEVVLESGQPALNAKAPPQWAVAECQGLAELAKVAYYWTDRQDETGSFGFGLNDDCEMYGPWFIFILAADDPLITDSMRRAMDYVWYDDKIQQGYLAAPYEAEHAAEATSYSTPRFTYADYGNPIYIERMMRTAKHFEHWTAINAAGHRLMRSNYFGALESWDFAYYGSDATINSRAFIPIMHYAMYNQDPDLVPLMEEYGRAWVDHAKSTRWGKPYGVLPGEIVWKTDELGGFCKNWWDTASTNFSMHHHPKYMSSLHEFLAVTYLLTGNEEYLLPARETLKFYENLTPENVPDKVTLWPTWYDTTDEYGRPAWKAYRSRINNVTGFYKHVTGQIKPTACTRQMALSTGQAASEAAARHLETAKTINIQSSIDNYRAYLPIPGFPELYHGGGETMNLPAPACRWYKTRYQMGCVLLDHTPSHFKAICCNIADEVRTYGLQLFELQPGSYRLSYGVDSDGDDTIEQMVQDKTVNIDRGSICWLEMVPGHEYIIELNQIDKKSGWEHRTDPAVCAQDIFCRPAHPQPGTKARLEIRLHNIGTVDATNVTVRIEELGSGRLIGNQTIKHLPRPARMVPSNIWIIQDWKVGDRATGVRVVIDEKDQIEEIYEGNNVAEAKRAALLSEPRRKRMLFMPTWYLDDQLDRPRATYTAPFVKSIKLDGRIDEPAWQKAEHYKMKPAWPEDKEVIKRTIEKETFLRIGYGDDALYFAFECPEPRMDLIKANARMHDSTRSDVSIFEDDAIEIFTDVNLDLTTYAQWVFNTLGTRAEGQYYNFSIFNEPWEAQVIRGDDYWSAEVRIPYTSLGAVAQPGETWGINVYRNVKTFESPKGEISEDQRHDGWKEAESHCFSVPYFGYHNARRFGQVTFGPQ